MRILKTLTPIVPLALLTALPAQDAVLAREVEFIRAIARDLGLISLAQEETDRLLKTQTASSDFKLVAQLGIEISLFGAKAIRNDRERQRTLFKDALDRSKEFIDRYKGDRVALQAQITMADACYEFGRFLTDEVEIARVESPERVKDLEEQAAAVFQSGKDTCDEVMSGLSSAARTDPDAKLKRYIAWLRKGILLREHARAVKKDRAYLASAARSTLEDLVMDIGEETILGMRAMFENSQVDEVIGKFDMAADNYRGTVDAIFEVLTELELPPSSRELLGSMMQECYDRLTTTLLTIGKSEEMLVAVGQFGERMKKLGADEDPRFGHSVRLNEARALAESGDKAKVQQALTLAATINEQHPSDVIGLKAKSILREILAVQSSLVSGELLYQVALGDFQSRLYEPAIIGFKRALAAMTADEKRRVALPAYTSLGRAFGAQLRPLEAVMTLKIGLEAHGDADAAAASDAARYLETALKQLRLYTRNDANLAALTDAGTQLAARYGSSNSADKLAWSQASDFMNQRRYPEAATEFTKVTPDSPYYELALVRKVQAFKAAKDLAQANAAADAYKAWRQTEAGQKPSTNRDLAQAELEFNLADMLYMQANGEFSSGKKDPTRFPQVTAALADYAQKHGTVAPNLTQYALDMLARSYAEVGKLDMAEETYRNLRRFNNASPLIAKLATAIFSGHYEMVKSLSNELEEAIKLKSDRRQEVTQKLATARRATVAFGLDYARSADDPQYSILFISLENADTLRDWTSASDLANRIVDKFGTGAEKDKVDTYVRPIQGKILLRQHKYQEAYDSLIAAEKQLDAGGVMRAAAFPVKELICQALGGWMELDERGSIQPFPGLGKPVEAYEKYWNEVRKFALSSQRGVTDYSLDWYDFHWNAFYYAQAAERVDSKYKRFADTIYSIARAADNFDTVNGLGPKGRELYALFMAIRR